jgi:hypothetical protein
MVIGISGKMLKQQETNGQTSSVKANSYLKPNWNKESQNFFVAHCAWLVNLE